jgi:hypothetical protein
VSVSRVVAAVVSRREGETIGGRPGRQPVRNGKCLGVRVNGDDSLALEIARDASARDLKGINDIAR